MLNHKTHIFLSAFFLSVFSTNAFAESLTSVKHPIFGETLLEEVQKRIPQIRTNELKNLLKEHPETVLIDVRNTDELTVHHGWIDSPYNYHIPRGWIEYFAPQSIPNADTPIVVYCGTGKRSPFATETLIKMGYSNVTNYLDGFIEWRNNGLPVETDDNAPLSFLHSKPQHITANVWSAIGATAPPTYKNSGHNNNLSFIITDEGVVVINAGDNYLLAKALHEEIKSITKQPVKYVVLENSQGHAMLGSNYWQEQGAKIIAHIDAANEIKNNGKESLDRMKQGRKDKALGTVLTNPDITFKDSYELKLGDEIIQILHLGPTHSFGDVSVWLPKKKLVIAGDIAFHQRLLLVSEDSDTAAWIETWDRFAALDAEIVIPGHGIPTNMAMVTKYTRDYLIYMRSEVEKILDEEYGLAEAYKIDQSAYSHLDTFDELAKQNAGVIFRAMEFE